MQLERMRDSVNSVLDGLERKIVIDRARDAEKLIRLSKAEFDNEVQFMLATRKPVEEPVPSMNVPLQFQANGTTGPHVAPGGPMQLAFDQAASGYAMGADPRMAVAQSKPTNMHDALVEIVRNRGKDTPMEAFEKVMGKIDPATNGTLTKVR